MNVLKERVFLNADSVTNNNRNATIDILKGIGIIAIVIGHATWDITFSNKIIFHIGQFVYLFHVGIFFCVGGMLLRDSSVSDPWKYFSKRFKSLYIPFLKYSIILLLVRPVFCKLGIFPPYGNIMSYIQVFCNVVLFQCWGETTSAMWFLPVYFIGLVITCFVFARYKQFISRIIIVIIIGLFGCFLIKRSCQFLYRLEVAFLMVPIVAIGHGLNVHIDKIKVSFPCESILILAVLYIFMVRNNWTIEVSQGVIMSPTLFYLVSLWGIGGCVLLSKEISLSPLHSFFEILGRNSFSIMAFHLAVSKFIDYILITIGGVGVEQLTTFPRVSQRFCILYWIANIFVPVLCGVLLSKIGMKLNYYKAIQKSNQIE